MNLWTYLAEHPFPPFIALAFTACAAVVLFDRWARCRERVAAADRETAARLDEPSRPMTRDEWFACAPDAPDWWLPSDIEPLPDLPDLAALPPEDRARVLRAAGGIGGLDEREAMSPEAAAALDAIELRAMAQERNRKAQEFNWWAWRRHWASLAPKVSEDREP